MARRTSEEILAQRDDWMARKAAREAGEDVPLQPPLKAGETAEVVTPAVAEPMVAVPEAAAAPQPVAEVQAETPAPVEPVAAQSVAVGAGAPQRPVQRRTSEEILAQREAWMARKAAGTSGQVAPPAPEAAVPVAAVAPVAAATPPTAPKPVAAPKPKAKAKPAAKKKKKAEPLPIDPNVTRRELLNYAWLASLGIFTAQSIGVSFWFAYPNFKAGEFGGAFNLGPSEGVLPPVNSPPVAYSAGKFWIANVDTESPAGEPRKGVVALFSVCTHLGCLYAWADVTVRFECPCHGSRFLLTGDYLAGPARRSLDRFVIIAQNPDGTERTRTNLTGDPLEVETTDTLIVDTGDRIDGSSDIVVA